MRAALARPELAVAVPALDELEHLPEEERIEVIHLALSNPDPAVVEAAQFAAETC